MVDGVYNKAVYWPNEIEEKVNNRMGDKFLIRLSVHAEKRIAENHLPKDCYKAFLFGEIVEVEIKNGSVKKIVTRLRHRYNSKKFICSAILLDFDVAFVKTVWVNNEDDNHETIIAYNYVNPGKERDDLISALRRYKAYGSLRKLLDDAANYIEKDDKNV